MTIQMGNNATGSPAPVTELPELVEEPKSPEPKDPARVAAGLLLARALRCAGTDLSVAGANGAIVVVTVPAASWTPIALDVWQTEARKDARSQDGFRERYWNDPDWISWAPVEIQRDHALRDAAEILAMAVAHGCHCAAFTCNLEWLPADLVFSADHQLVMPLLCGADVVAVATEVSGGQHTVEFSDEQAAILTPRLLRLARRPGQTADIYLGRLCELLERDRSGNAAMMVKKPSTSVRESPGLDRLHGMPQAVEWGKNLAKDLRLFRAGKIAWVDVDQGLLLSGPPGCGKTLYARSLAVTCDDIPLLAGSYGEWLGTGGGHQGDLLKSMRQVFKKARDCAPSILFIDEVDSFPNRGTLTHRHADREIQVVNALLSEIDGVQGREGVVLLAACNHPEKLDPALVRSGRLDRHIRIDLPDRPALISILREHLGCELAGQSLLTAAVAGDGATGADCERFVRGARRRARNAGRALLLADLLAEIRGDDSYNPLNLRIAAIHEAGHVIAYLELQPGALTAVSLRPTGNSGGMTKATGRSGFVSAQAIRQRLIIGLAGRAAEEATFGEASSGAGGATDSDLAMTTQIAVNAATSLGLDPELGLVWLGAPDPANLFKMLGTNPALAARVRVVIDESYAQALALVRRRFAAVQALADALFHKRAIDGDEAKAIAALHPEDPSPASS